MSVYINIDKINLELTTAEWKWLTDYVGSSDDVTVSVSIYNKLRKKRDLLTLLHDTYDKIVSK
jgi:hypothetical protein